MRIVRIYTGADQRSHFEDVEVELQDTGMGGRMSALFRARGVIFRETDGDYALGFHNAPRRQYVVNLEGAVEIEVGSGEKRVLGPGSVLLAEDTTGEGHISRAVDGQPRVSLFIPLQDDA